MKQPVRLHLFTARTCSVEHVIDQRRVVQLGVRVRRRHPTCSNVGEQTQLWLAGAERQLWQLEHLLTARLQRVLPETT